MMIADELEKVAAQMRSGEYTASSEAILLTRDVETGMVTICRWGEGTQLLKDAYELKRPNA